MEESFPSEEQTIEIQAAVLRDSRDPLKIEPLELEGPKDDEVLVRIVASGVCHTDIGMCESWSRNDPPVVLGHEGAGVVVRTGGLVKDIRVGDHVVLSYESCGRCPQCLGERPWTCQHFYEANFGFHRLDGSNALRRSGVGGHFFGQSSFATYSVASERNTVKVPVDLDLDVFGPLGCGIQTGAGTVMNSLAVSRGAGIAVLGTGAVGLAAVMAAKVVGANPIIGVDINPMRLKLALELGATHVIDGRETDVLSFVSRITGRGVDNTIESTGDMRVQRIAVELLNPGGTAAFLVGASGFGSLDAGRKAINVIQGSAVPQKFIPRLIALYKEGLFPFDRLVKHYDFSEINRAIADAKRGGTIKPVLKIGEA